MDTAPPSPTLRATSSMSRMSTRREGLSGGMLEGTPAWLAGPGLARGLPVMFLISSGPALSPVSALCLLWEPSHRGKWADLKQRHSATTPEDEFNASRALMSSTSSMSALLVGLSGGMFDATP